MQTQKLMENNINTHTHTHTHTHTQRERGRERERERERKSIQGIWNSNEVHTHKKHK